MNEFTPNEFCEECEGCGFIVNRKGEEEDCSKCIFHFNWLKNYKSPTQKELEEAIDRGEYEMQQQRDAKYE